MAEHHLLVYKISVLEIQWRLIHLICDGHIFAYCASIGLELEDVFVPTGFIVSKDLVQSHKYSAYHLSDLLHGEVRIESKYYLHIWLL